MLTVKNKKDHDYASMSLVDIVDGNSKDCHFTYLIYEKLLDTLIELKLDKVYSTLIEPLTHRFAEIEYHGMRVDTSVLETLEPILKAEIAEVVGKIKEIPEVSSTDNLSSSKDLKEIFFEREGGFELLPVSFSKKTGEPSLDVNAKEKLADLIEEELERRK